MAPVIRLSREQPSAKIDIVIQQGATFRLTLAAVETIDPRQLLTVSPGWVARSRVKAAYDSTLILDMTTANGRITIGPQGTTPEDWNVLITLTATETDTLTDWGLGVWDLELFDPFNNVMRLAEGRARLSRAATR